MPIMRPIPVLGGLIILTSLQGFAGEIHEAALRGNIEKVRQLLGRDPAIIESEDANKRRPLFWAASGGHQPIVNLLLSSGAEVAAKAPHDGTALSAAACNGHAAVVKQLLTHGAEPDEPGPLYTPLHCAAFNGHEAVGRTLIEAGATPSLPNKHGKSAFHIALDQDRLKFAKFLLGQGVPVDIRDGQGRTPLENALLDQKKERIRFLLSNKADINADGGRPLRIAIMSEDPDFLKFLMASHPSMRVRDKGGESPLHWAAGGRRYIDFLPTAEQLQEEEAIYLRLVLVLLKQPAVELDATNTEGKTPLQLAERKGFQSIARVLRKHGARNMSHTDEQKQRK